MNRSFTRLAVYLQTIDGFIYPRSPTTSFPKSSGVNAPVGAQDMPIHSCVDDFRPPNLEVYEASRRPASANYSDETPRPQFLGYGTWVIAQSGIFKHDIGVVVEDDYEETDICTKRLVAFVPRELFSSKDKRTNQKRAGKPSTTVEIGQDGFQVPREIFRPVRSKYWARPRPNRPPQVPDLGDWFTLPTDVLVSRLHKAYPDRDLNIKVSCVKWCRDPVACDHDDPVFKRYYNVFRGQVLRGGLALVEYKLEDLKAVVNIDDHMLRRFRFLPNDSLIWSKIPPPSSWSFYVGDAVLFTQCDGIDTMNAGISFRVSDLAFGSAGIIRRVEMLYCEVDFAGSLRALPHRYLIKNIEVGQVVEIASGVPDMMESKRIQLGDVGAISKDRFVLGGKCGLAAGVTARSVEVWLDVGAAEGVLFIMHRNSVRLVDQEVSTFASRPPTLFQPRVTNRDGFIHQNPEVLRVVSDLDLRSEQSELVWIDASGTETRFGEVRSGGNPFDELKLVSKPLSTYTGQPPWLGLEVVNVGKSLHKGYEARVKDVRKTLSNRSGLELYIQYEVRNMAAGLHEWVAYEDVRLRSNRGFLHESAWNSKNVYYDFKPGYWPTYSVADWRLLDGFRKRDEAAAAAEVQEAVNKERVWEAEVLKLTHWIEQPAFAKPVADLGVQLEVGQLDGAGMRRVSLTIDDSENVCVWEHTGSMAGGVVNGPVALINPFITIPDSHRSPTLKIHSNQLYIVSSGEHTGKFCRRLDHTGSSKDVNLCVMVLQPVYVIPKTLQKGRKSKECSVSEADATITVNAGLLVVVHESAKEAQQGSAALKTIREKYTRERDKRLLGLM